MLLASRAVLADGSVKPDLQVMVPRDFGYTIGDLIEHQIQVSVERPFELDEGRLPGAGALNEWLQLRRVEWSRVDRRVRTEYRIIVTYQVFRGVRETEDVIIPSLLIPFRHGEQTVEARTPPWRFSVVPLIPPRLADEKVVIRDERPPVPPALGRHRDRLSLFLLGIASIIAGWLWWAGVVPWTGRWRRPFAKAVRQLRGLRSVPDPGMAHRLGFEHFHEALNATAGYAVFADGLDRFVGEQPAFSSVKTELIQFFAASRRLFFAGSGRETVEEFSLSRLHELCVRCWMIERGQR